jgi:hypothetical protein
MPAAHRQFPSDATAIGRLRHLPAGNELIRRRARSLADIGRPVSTAEDEHAVLGRIRSGLALSGEAFGILEHPQVNLLGE